MSKLRVTVCGRNLLMSIDGQKSKMGFYTQVLLEAQTAGEAENRALEMLRQDSELQLSILNLPKDPPRLVVEETKEVETQHGASQPRTGLALCPDEES